MIIPEDESVWSKIEADLSNDIPYEYEVLIPDGEAQVGLRIDIDLGGGFEAGFATTTFSSPLNYSGDFRFAIHHQGFIDEIGKFFGMQDEVLGYPEFDRKVMVKTNNPELAVRLFADPETRETIQSLYNFSFGIVGHHTKDKKHKDFFLELIVEEAVTEASELKKLFKAFTAVLAQLEAQS